MRGTLRLDGTYCSALLSSVKRARVPAGCCGRPAISRLNFLPDFFCSMSFTRTFSQSALVVYFTAITCAYASLIGMRSLSKVRAISFDITGTLLIHKYPIMDTYAASAVWAQLPNPPTSAELKPAFKKAYFQQLTKSPCFGARDGLSSRQW